VRPCRRLLPRRRKASDVPPAASSLLWLRGLVPRQSLVDNRFCPEVHLFLAHSRGTQSALVPWRGVAFGADPYRSAQCSRSFAIAVSVGPE